MPIPRNTSRKNKKSPAKSSPPVTAISCPIPTMIDDRLNNLSLQEVALARQNIILDFHDTVMNNFHQEISVGQNEPDPISPLLHMFKQYAKGHRDIIRLIIEFHLHPAFEPEFKLIYFYKMLAWIVYVIDSQEFKNYFKLYHIDTFIYYGYLLERHIGQDVNTTLQSVINIESLKASIPTEFINPIDRILSVPFTGVITGMIQTNH
jgi:hypothetical protein